MKLKIKPDSSVLTRCSQVESSSPNLFPIRWNYSEKFWRSIHFDLQKFEIGSDLSWNFSPINILVAVHFIQPAKTTYT